MMKCILSKRVIVVILVFSFILATPVNMIAEEYEKDETVSVITQDTFQELFAGKARSVDSLDVDSVKYTFSFEVQEENNVANVEMNTIFTISNQDYAVVLEGSVDGFTLENGEIFWEGPIEGIIEINEIEYLVIASFAKLGTSSNNVQVCATIQTLDSENSISPVVIQFGEDIITEEIYVQCYDNIQNTNEDERNIEIFDLHSMQSRTVVPFVCYDNKAIQFNGAAMSGYAQNLFVYSSDDNTNRLAARVVTYPDNVNAYFKTWSTSVTDVYSLTVSLIRGAYTEPSFSSILGMELFDFEIQNFDVADVDLRPLFLDALGCIGFSSNTYTSLLDNLKGKITRTEGTNAYSVTLQGISGDVITDRCGLPFVFQMMRTQSGYVGNSQYTMKSTVRYISIYLPHYSEVFSISYTDGGTVEIPFAVTFR